MYLAVILLSICILALTSRVSFAAEEQKLTFHGADNTPISATLLLPAHETNAEFPALVLIAGSGPTDRDGNQPPTLITEVLKQIAESLAAKNIATLRFDKRGMYANSRFFPKDKSQWETFFCWENFIGDSAAAFRFLREQPHIDPNHVGILGHSEGGLLALEVARVLKSENRPPLVLILLSTPGRTIDQIMSDQLKSMLARQGATAQQTKYFLDENARITESIRGSGKIPADVPAGLVGLYPSYLGKFFQSELACDPRKLALEFSGPVLVVAGSADVQVSPTLDAKALDSVLASRSKDIHTLAIIPSASHNLKLLKTPEDPGFTGPIAPAAIDQVTSWTSAHLSGE